MANKHKLCKLSMKMATQEAGRSFPQGVGLAASNEVATLEAVNPSGYYTSAPDLCSWGTYNKTRSCVCLVPRYLRLC